ncbi:TPA: hypothetical protein ENS27_15280, partial [bacterium]|nr:hypothetical protein [bacterium]
MTYNEQSDFDSPWKDILDNYFTEFMAFFFPQAYDDIDWSKGYESLDTELQQIVQDSELGKRIVDKLVKVWLNSGEESWILIHIEIQSQRETSFAKRMYIYNYRIFDRYDRFVISFAILGDEHPSWKPNRFGYEMWGFKVGIEFPIIKLLDYSNRWDELEKSQNPFAIVVMAHLKAQETSNSGEDRRKWKFYLARLLYERGYKREDIIQLLKFIDWIMKLPENLDIKFWQEVQQLEEEKLCHISVVWKESQLKMVWKRDYNKVFSKVCNMK